MSEIKIEYTKLEEKSANLLSAIEAYEQFGKKPFIDEREKIDAMNTDFLAKFNDMLDDLNHSNTDVIDKLKEVQKVGSEILIKYVEYDEGAASRIAGEKDE